MNLKKAVIAAVASGALLLSGFTQAFAADVLVTGNGAFTHNFVNVDSSHELEVIQRNISNTTNTVVANALTGGNNASGNTGGNVTVQSGAATTNVGIVNEGNKNILSVPQCTTCGQDNTHVVVAGNGYGSHTFVNVDSNEETRLVQSNNTHVTNTVVATSATGGNNASGNTGSSHAVWYPTGNVWYQSNNWWTDHERLMKFHTNFVPHVFNTGHSGSTTVTSGPAHTNVGLFNGGNLNVLHN